MQVRIIREGDGIGAKGECRDVSPRCAARWKEMGIAEIVTPAVDKPSEHEARPAAGEEEAPEADAPADAGESKPAPKPKKKAKKAAKKKKKAKKAAKKKKKA